MVKGIESIKNTSKLTLLIIITEFLIVYASISKVSSGLYTDALVLSIVLSIYLFYKFRSDAVIWPEKTFSFLYWSSFLLLMLSAAFTGYKESFITVLTYIYWSALPLYAAYLVFQRQFHLRTVIVAVNCALLTLSAAGFYQFFTSPTGTRIKGYIHHWALFSDLLIFGVTILIIYCLYAKESHILRAISAIVSILACFLIVVSGARGGIIGFCLGALIFLLIRNVYIKRVGVKKLVIGSLTVILAVICVGGAFWLNFHQSQADAVRSYDGERILIWQSSYHMWQEHKIAGVGLGHWEEEYNSHYILPQAKQHDIWHAHNQFLYFLSSAGLLGGIGYLIFSLGLFIYFCKKAKEHPDDIVISALLWALLAIMIQGCVDATLLRNYIMRAYSLYLGIGLASVTWQKRKAIANRNE